MPSDFEESMERLQEAVRSTMKALGPQLAEPVSGLTGPQFFILHQLDQKGECMVGELAESMGVKPSAITAMIDRLHKHGFVSRERDEADRRVVHIRLSPTGKAALTEARQKRKGILKHYVSHLTSEELNSLIHIFEKLAQVGPAAKKE